MVLPQFDDGRSYAEKSAPARLSDSARSTSETAFVPDLRFELFTEMEPLEAEWRQLEADNLNSFHQSYDWCASWARCHGHPLAIIRVLQGDRAVLLLPLEIVRFHGIRVARFIGDRFNNINTGLFEESFRPLVDASTAQAICDGIRIRLKGRADLVSLQNIPMSWRHIEHPFSGVAAIENQNRTFQLPLLDSFEATLSQLNAKRRRKKFRVQTRRLEATGGFEHIIATAPEDKHALLNLFFRQKAERFRAFGMPDVFQSAAVRDSFHRLLDTVPEGHNIALELHAIRLKGQCEGTVAAIAGLSRKGDHVICQFGSIDKDAAPDASPGELLFWLMIERACREKATIFDFGLGDQPYKRSWCTLETVQHDILLPITAAGRFAASVQTTATRLKTAIKANPRLYAFLQKLRAGSGVRKTTETSAED